MRITFGTFLFGGLYTEDAKGYNPALPWRKREVRQALNLAVDKWSRIGVKAKIVSTEWGAIRPTIRAREANYAVGFSLGVFAEDVWGINDLPPFSFFEISPELTAAIRELKAAVTMEELTAAIGNVGDIKLKEFVEVPIPC